jgi:hypothetical protein
MPLRPKSGKMPSRISAIEGMAISGSVGACVVGNVGVRWPGGACRDTSLSFAEIKRLSHINARAQAADEAPDFSQRIRAGLPRQPLASR